MNMESSPTKATLFRTQVIEQKTDRLHGDVLLLPRISHSILIVFLLVWLVAVGIWLATSSYARKETVIGWLEPSAGVVRLYPEASGQIKQILVKEGDKVSAGTVLAKLNTSVIQTNLSELDKMTTTYLN